jgi:hypothetical protein
MVAVLEELKIGRLVVGWGCRISLLCSAPTEKAHSLPPSFVSACRVMCEW